MAGFKTEVKGKWVILFYASLLFAVSACSGPPVVECDEVTVVKFAEDGTFSVADEDTALEDLKARMEQLAGECGGLLKVSLWAEEATPPEMVVDALDVITNSGRVGRIIMSTETQE